jgi:hypothetical protein
MTGSGGGLIVFSSWQRNDWQIHLINADGSSDRRVGNRHGYEPNWSPDGSKMVFQYDGLWIADLASDTVTKIPVSVKDNNLPNEYMVKPAWSPDGQWIAFLNENGTYGDLYLIHPDGSGLARLTTTNAISRDGNLVWSPDGRRIAYSAERDGNIEIYLQGVEEAMQGNQDVQQLTNTDSPMRNLVTSWAQDGSMIAFSSDRDHNTEIYIMKPDGSKIIRLTNNPSYDGEPAWSPDGKRLAFSSDREGNFEIYIMDITAAISSTDDSSITRLTENPGDDVGPVWMPNSSMSIFNHLPEKIDPQAKYVIYLHGKIMEDKGLQNPTDPRFGLYDYSGILGALAGDNNQVISEVRPANTGVEYASHVVEQINLLLNAGVAPENITVVGFSKGGALAILASTQFTNEHVKYVILAGSCSVDVLEQDPSIVFHGQVLSIYEASDEYGQSCQAIADRSPKSLVFKEIRLETGWGHGEFYLPREEWINPVLDWINK